MSRTNFREATYAEAEIEQIDRLFQVPWIFLTNQSALFQQSIAMLL